MSDRYDTAGSPEGQFQPGSERGVLLNKPGITGQEEMEFDTLLAFQHDLFDVFPVDKQITADDVCSWHRNWLGAVYEWAGDYCSVNMSKEGFVFAASHLIPKLMSDFELDFLSKFTPCCGMSQAEVTNALAVCHIEFIVIHPFRDGNGRIGRVLSTVMALQANMPVLDFEILEKDKDRYIAAIHADHARDYEPMKQLFSETLDYSVQKVSQYESNE